MGRTKSKQCSNWLCGNQNPQPVTNFHKLSKSKDGYKDQCKDCRLAYQREYDANNNEAIKAKKQLRRLGLNIDEQFTALTALARDLGVKLGARLKIYLDDQQRTAVRKAIREKFTTKTQKAAVFNLLAGYYGIETRA